jgi:hypothetical protein
MGIFDSLFGKRKKADSSETSKAKVENNVDKISEQKIKITNVLKKARSTHELPQLADLLDVLVTVETITNYATLVEIALESAAEYRGIYMGELKSAYMQCWWQWHNHKNESKYRAEKIVVIAGDAAQASSHSKIGWTLINSLEVWVSNNCPDKSDVLKEIFGEIPTLDEIRKYQSGA